MRLDRMDLVGLAREVVGRSRRRRTLARQTTSLRAWAPVLVRTKAIHQHLLSRTLCIRDSLRLHKIWSLIDLREVACVPGGGGVAVSKAARTRQLYNQRKHQRTKAKKCRFVEFAGWIGDTFPPQELYSGRGCLECPPPMLPAGCFACPPTPVLPAVCWLFCLYLLLSAACCLVVVLLASPPLALPAACWLLARLPPSAACCLLVILLDPHPSAQAEPNRPRN